MPCYNAGKYIKEAIESVLNQSYNDWELIVVDDGSTDNSLTIANSVSDKRIKVFSQPNSGACVARNKGIDMSSGEYLKFLDADDILEKDCLKNQLEQIKSLNDNQVPFGDYDNIDEYGKEISTFLFSEHPDMLDILRKDQPYFFFNYWHILISSPLLRKKDLVACGGYDVELKRGQESDMHFRLALYGIEFVYFQCVTFSYRCFKSSTRISTVFAPDSNLKKQADIIRLEKCEKLILEKYGCVPKQYKLTFENFWFNRARTAWAQKNKTLGQMHIQRVLDYHPDVTFIKFYCFIGAIIGYDNLESIFRLRLKLLNK